MHVVYDPCDRGGHCGRIAGADVLAVLVRANRTASADGTLADITGWHHVAFTYQANTTGGLKLYLDGSPVACVNTTTFAILTSGTDPLTVGNSSQGPASAKDMNGFIDEVAIFDTALSAGDIALLAGGTDPTTLPEPTTSVLLAALGCVARGRGRRRS